MAGNFFVIRAVGAVAEKGADLHALVALAKRVSSITRTMGIALTSRVPPTKGTSLFELGDDEMEVGIGIHGEPGRRREKTKNADAIVDELLAAILSRPAVRIGRRGCRHGRRTRRNSISELYIPYGVAYEKLEKKGIRVVKNYVGECCTSLAMAGASLTLVKLGHELAELLEAPAEIAIRIF